MCISHDGLRHDPLVEAAETEALDMALRTWRVCGTRVDNTRRCVAETEAAPLSAPIAIS